MTTDEFIDRLGKIRRINWYWKWMRSPVRLIAALGEMLNVDPPYRSPHSSAGNITLCDGIPFASCVRGNWHKRGMCCLEETILPPLTADEKAAAERDGREVVVGGMCALRRIGRPALTPQVSREPYSPPLPVERTPQEVRHEALLRTWLAGAHERAKGVSGQVGRAALAYHDPANNRCSEGDIQEFGLWLNARFKEDEPWRTTDSVTR